jgi:hypothetical protein
MESATFQRLCVLMSVTLGVRWYKPQILATVSSIIIISSPTYDTASDKLSGMTLGTSTTQ